MNWLQENYVNILAVLGAAYAVALAVVKITPTPRDDEALEKVSVFVRAIAAVFGLNLKQGVARDDGPRKTDVMLALLICAALMTGCQSEGDRYQASSIAFVTAVDAATALRKAGKLDPPAVKEIGGAIEDGHAALKKWAAALKAKESFPEGTELLVAVVNAIRRHLKEED